MKNFGLLICIFENMNGMGSRLFQIAKLILFLPSLNAKAEPLVVGVEQNLNEQQLGIE